MTRTLDVWLGDAKVGCLGQDETGALTFAYDAAYPKRGDASA